MTKHLRLAEGLLCLGVLALGVVAFDFSCLRNAPLPGDSEVRPVMADEVVRREQLRQREEAIHRRNEAKRHVAGEVIAGRRSLAEALELFRELDREWRENHRGPRALEVFGVSEDEWHGREVVRFVRLVLAVRPDEAATVAGRLETELQQLLAERKKCLPAPAQQRTEERSH
jgi:hypothetical protein